MMAPTRLLLVAMLAAIGLFGGASGASGQEPTWIRLAHLSPTTPPMDVYVAPAAGGGETVVLTGIAYGAVSTYTELMPGPHVFTWRPAGSPVAERPVLTLSAQLEPGSAYTVAGVGQGDEVRSILISDDLTPPAPGQARVRFINADTSSGSVDLSVVDGPLLVQDATFAAVTDYGSIPAGTQTIRVVTDEAPDGATMDVDLPAGSVNTLLLLETDSPVGDLSAVLDAPGMSMISETAAMATVQDAVGSPAMPAVGAVEAGAGGTSRRQGPTTPLLLAGVLATVTVLAAAGITATSRRAACDR